MPERLVVVGNGMAGIRTIEELLRFAPDRYRITVFGAEPYGNYNRLLLSPLLAGERQLAEIMLNGDDWYAEHEIVLHKGKAVTAMDRRRRLVAAADGTVAAYDRLLLATGSLPIRLRIPGADLPGVLGFRDISDVDAMLEAVGRRRHAVVIGGGLLGLEAANGLAKRGMSVTVVHLMDALMERQLDAEAASLLRASLEARGLRFVMPAETAALLGQGRVQAVRLADGRELPADLVIMAVGIAPNIALARAAGLHCRRGIVVDHTMQSFDPRIYAVGECAESDGKTYGLVAPLFEQAKVCASHLAEWGHARYAGSIDATSLKVTGIDLFSAGRIGGGPGSEAIVLRDSGTGIYKKIFLRGGRIEGAVLYGDCEHGARYVGLMREKRDVSAEREALIFGPAA